MWVKDWSTIDWRGSSKFQADSFPDDKWWSQKFKGVRRIEAKEEDEKRMGVWSRFEFDLFGERSSGPRYGIMQDALDHNERTLIDDHKSLFIK